MNDHLTLQQMLAFLDGELPRLETRKVESHLHSCWTCRSAAERLKGDIGTILDALNERFAPALPPPPLPWPSFNALLARSAPPLPSMRSRISAYMSSLLNPVRVLVVTSVIALLLIFAYSTFRSKPVSAQEVLRQVRIAEMKRNTVAKDQVIRERVQIRRSSHGGSRQKTGELDAWKSPTAAYWNMEEGDSAGAELAAEYKAHDIPIALPLSAASVDSVGNCGWGP